MEVEELRPESEKQFSCSSAVFIIQPHSLCTCAQLTAQLLPAQRRTLYKLAEPEVPSWLSMCISASRGGRRSAKGKEERNLSPQVKRYNVIK